MSNWAQLIIISFSFAVRVAKHHSKHQNIFVDFSEMLKKIMVKNWILSKIPFISFRERMLQSKQYSSIYVNRIVSVHTAKESVLMSILFILLCIY